MFDVINWSHPFCQDIGLLCSICLSSMVSIETFFLPPRRLIELETLENLIQKTHSHLCVQKKSLLLVNVFSGTVGGVTSGLVGPVGS